MWGTPIELITSMQSALKLPLIHLIDGSLAVAERDLSALHAKAKAVRNALVTGNTDSIQATAAAGGKGTITETSSASAAGGAGAGTGGSDKSLPSSGSGRGSALFKSLSNKVIGVLSMKKRARFAMPDSSPKKQ